MSLQKEQRNTKPVLKPKLLSVRLTAYQFDELSRYAEALRTTKTALLESAISRHLNYLSEKHQLKERLDNAPLA